MRKKSEAITDTSTWWAQVLLKGSDVHKSVRIQTCSKRSIPESILHLSYHSEKILASRDHIIQPTIVSVKSDRDKPSSVIVFNHQGNLTAS